MKGLTSFLQRGVTGGRVKPKEARVEKCLGPSKPHPVSRLSLKEGTGGSGP